MGRSRGINVYEEAWEQLTREKAFEGYMPERVCISLSQNGEAICRPTVLPGEYVCRGQVIGEAESEDEACVHASIAGYVEEVTDYQRAPGVFEPYVKIRKENEKAREWHPFAVDFGRKAMAQAMHRIGLPKKRLPKSEVLIVNGFANEPYITSGYRLMMESPGKIVIGAILGAMAAEAETVYICINEDAFDAVARMKRAVQKYGKNMGNQRPIWVLSMKRKYPNGNEKMLRKEVLGREKATAAVVSVAEMAALYDGIYDGEPWTRVGITVSGEVAVPKNLWVPIGTNVQDIIDYCGGKASEAVIIHGGPLGGRTVDGPNTWVTRETCGLLVLRPPESFISPCIHCGLCREVCPQGLMPDQIEAKYLDGGEVPENLRASECIKCGLCSYVCPSGRRLTEYIDQVKKGRIREKSLKQAEKSRGDYIDIPTDRKVFRRLKPLERRSESAPHIHRRGTIYDVMKHSVIGLIPLIGAAFYKHPGQSVHLAGMLIVGAFCALLSEYFWQTFRNEYVSVRDGSAFFSGLFLALLFPVETPLWKVALAAITAILVGKQAFGGIGKSPIHPVIVGKLLFSPFELPFIENLWPFALFSLVWMCLKRMCPAAYPLAFLVVLGVGRPENLLSASILLCAAYLIWSYETMPPSRVGRWTFALAAGVLTLLFQFLGVGTSSVFFAVACMDLAVPLLEFPSVKRV